MKFPFALALATCILATSANSLSAQDNERVFYVKISKANDLEGQIIEVTELKVTTGFGEVTIPFGKIEAIKLHADNKDAAVIAFTNGDMITGQVNIDELHLKTNWGKAHINMSSVDSFSVSKFGNFYSEPNNGGWRYSRGNASNSRARASGSNSIRFPGQ